MGMKPELFTKGSRPNRPHGDLSGSLKSINLVHMYTIYIVLVFKGELGAQLKLSQARFVFQ